MVTTWKRLSAARKQLRRHLSNHYALTDGEVEMLETDFRLNIGVMFAELRHALGDSDREQFFTVAEQLQRAAENIGHRQLSDGLGRLMGTRHSETPLSDGLLDDLYGPFAELGCAPEDLLELLRQGDAPCDDPNPS